MKIISNLAVSIDGKIATQSRELFWLGSSYDHKRMEQIRNKTDAVLMGASTLKAFRNACLPQKKKSPFFNIVFSQSFAGVDLNWPFFKNKEIQRIIVLTKKTPVSTIEKIKKTSVVLDLSKSKNKMRDLVLFLKTKKIKTLLVEGGGTVMWEFVKDDRIDDYYITITPRVLGGTEAPTLVDGLGLQSLKVVNLKLIDTKKIGSELFLVYKSLKKRGRKHPLYPDS